MDEAVANGAGLVVGGVIVLVVVESMAVESMAVESMAAESTADELMAVVEVVLVEWSGDEWPQMKRRPKTDRLTGSGSATATIRYGSGWRARAAA